jgi:hypothetical protein
VMCPVASARFNDRCNAPMANATGKREAQRDATLRAIFGPDLREPYPCELPPPAERDLRLAWCYVNRAKGLDVALDQVEQLERAGPADEEPANSPCAGRVHDWSVFRGQNFA